MLDRIRPDQHVLPLLARVAPESGENWLSLLARAADANGFRDLADVLAFAGVGGRPAFTPFTAHAQAPALAALLSLPEAEIRARFHPGFGGAPGTRDIGWYGISIPRQMIECQARRLSPESLRRSTYHRAIWTVRPLSFCPESTELLISNCPACHLQLGWRRTAGLARCEHCSGWLLDHQPDRLAPHLVDDARAAAGLVSVSPSEREAALATLPEPFRSWGPAPVFEAITVLADAWAFAHRQSSDVDRSHRLAVAKATDCRHLVQGLITLRAWPNELAKLVKVLWDVAATAGSTSSLKAWAGPLARSARRVGKQRLIDSTLAADFPIALVEANIPVRANAQREVANLRRPTKISQKAAQEALGLAVKTLRRLDGKGGAIVSHDRRIKLYDREALRASVAAYQAAETDVVCAARLGVPAYCLPELAARGLLEQITDPDALLLTKGAALYASASRLRLEGQLGGSVVQRSAKVPLQQALLFVLAPSAWASVLSAMTTGEISPAIGTGAGGPLIGRIIVDPLEIDRVLAGADLSTFPVGATVSSLTAGRMIGLNDVLVCKAIEAGFLPATYTSKRYEIRLSSLALLAKETVTSAELARRAAVSRESVRSALEGLRPVATVYRRIFWPRQKAEKALGLPSLRAIAAL